MDLELAQARERLLSARTTEGCWQGQLSPSPFATASALIALRAVERSHPQFGISKLRDKIGLALRWLTNHSNPDGGWGDFPGCESNLMTTASVWAAFGLAGNDDSDRLEKAAEAFLRQKSDLTCTGLGEALMKELDDRVLVSWILALCAVSGRFGQEQRLAWKDIPPVALENTLLASGRRLDSLDSPAAVWIAAGQLIHQRHPGGNFFRKPVRDFAISGALKQLCQMQVEGGGFLGSIPIASLVLTSMAETGRVAHEISKPSMEFLLRTQRPDGSWALTPDISVSTTSEAIEALALAGSGMDINDSHAWLLEQQFKSNSHFSNAPSGGWSWTDAPDGAPNSRDTAAALSALWQARRSIAVPRSEQRHTAARAGLAWLVEVQNADGGVSTFDRSGDKTPAGISGADLTAGALRAWLAWRGELPSMRSQIDSAVAKAVAFIKQTQNSDGSWAAAWPSSAESSLVYATSRVALALSQLPVAPDGKTPQAPMLDKALQWLLSRQQPGGGWLGVEESAWAIEALAAAPAPSEPLVRALARGVEWLIDNAGSSMPSSVTEQGRFFSKVRYAENLRPLIATVAALSRAKLAGQ